MGMQKMEKFDVKLSWLVNSQADWNVALLMLKLKRSAVICQMCRLWMTNLC